MSNYLVLAFPLLISLVSTLLMVTTLVLKVRLISWDAQTTNKQTDTENVICNRTNRLHASCVSSW